ncbi:hypothetical protein M0R04_11460 [Candidatus Dojkabacteria bacterium]|jgi:hypothetical protein|nr:hypothetical protein [Candidatus Dojkabacteria bacterium]
MNNLLIITLVLSIVSTLCSIGALILGSLSLIKCIATEKATHSVHFTPVDDAYKEAWGTSESTINKQAKLYKEEIDKDMPVFAESEDDIKPYSF